jgi:hypothetical protein
MPDHAAGNAVGQVLSGKQQQQVQQQQEQNGC